MSLLGFILLTVASCVAAWIVQTVPSPSLQEAAGEEPE